MRRLLVVLLLVSGCSLPLPHDVKSVAGVEAEQRRSGELLQVIPPGPKPGQTPEEAVRGFLGAQANAEDRHAIARDFLTAAEAQAWDDAAEVKVYDLNTQRVATADTVADVAAVTVTAQVTGEIGPDGSYSPQPGTVVDSYGLERVKGEWRLSEVPAGLRLTAADRERSFRAVNVYYLAQTPKDAPPHLVPDRVFLPVAADEAPELVARLFRAPSQGLRGSVLFRTGLRAERVSTNGSGVVTVDLSNPLPDLSSAARQDLSAQLVWTLRELGPSFTGLRLLVGGRPLAVAGQGGFQASGAWDTYDPEGLGPNPPYYFVAARRLRSSGQLPSSTATAGDAGVGQAIGVDAVAVTPDRTQVALLDGLAPGPVTLWTGPLRGPTYRKALLSRDLRSPTWGSGDRGLWLLSGAHDIALLPPGATALTVVPVVGARPVGRFTALAASRDGSRVAVVADGQLYVGSVEVDAGGPRVVNLAAVDHGLRVQAVAWASGTELVVLGRRGSQVQVLREAVDGSSVEVLNTPGLVPTGLAASSAGLLLTSGGFLYSLSGRTPVRLGAGSAPAYPG